MHRIRFAVMVVTFCLVSSTLSRKCELEPGALPYDSYWNKTALRVCSGDERPEKVCIVGGGSSGVHFGWLLRRRGFVNTTLFEQNDRLGGDIWTRQPVGTSPRDTVIRELGAAFLSPDYVEVRALLRRFNMTEQPISAATQMLFHTPKVGGEELIQPPAEWADSWLSRITGSKDDDYNSKVVSTALERYFVLHASIFGEYGALRFPPEPKTDEQLRMIQGNGLEFLQRNGLEVLEPMFYQFFDLQGMGLLRSMPAYNMLKWCSPNSLKAGGFGGDATTPLAILPEGYGSLVEALAADVDLDVRLSTAVLAVERSSDGSPARIVTAHANGSTASSHSCDMVVLSGPIPQFVSGSKDGTRGPILHPSTTEEREIFASQNAMQFLIQLLDLNPSEVQDAFRALEFWPSNFQSCGKVIVRRDVAFAEEGEVAHRIGGVQSYSSLPWPDCNKTQHLEGHALWLAQHHLTVNQTIARAYFDNYLYHHDDAGIMARKPWRVASLQSPYSGTHTMYVGGSASYETVEDAIQHNLELADRFFDQNDGDKTHTSTWPYVEQLVPRLEQLAFSIPCARVDTFVEADAASWSRFVVRQKGFVRKRVLVEPNSNESMQENCTVWTSVQWSSLELWKAIPTHELSRVRATFISLFGSDPPPEAFPPETPNGLELLLDQPFPIETYAQNIDDARVPAKGMLETIVSQLNSCGDADAFSEADNATWTQFLSATAGYVRKFTLLRRLNSNDTCEAWTQTHWDSYDAWQAARTSPGHAAAAKAFAERLGYQPHYYGWPIGVGYLRVLDSGFDRDRAAPVMATHASMARADTNHNETPWWSRGPRVIAVGGNDVVAYHELNPGVDHDVHGTPEFRRFLPANEVLFPADNLVRLPRVKRDALIQLHPEPYEFWFASAENAALFDDDPHRYLPAFGGHCTHGIATMDNQLSAEQLVDGRLAFTCINTTRWSLLNDTLYMNSCGMYEDFLKNPEGDVEKAEARWRQLFGAAYSVGPINDACFQDEYAWGGNPVGGLLPPHCNIV